MVIDSAVTSPHAIFCSYMSVDPLAAYSIQQLLGYAAPALLLAVKDMMEDVFMALDGYQTSHLTQFILILNRYIACSNEQLALGS
jgi:hypothetical protein